MRKMRKWEAKDVSQLYWLSVWGYSPQEIAVISKEILPDRSDDAVSAMLTNVRKYHTKELGYVLKRDLSLGEQILVKKATKIQPTEQILPFKKEDAAFKPVSIRKDIQKPVFKPSPNFEQVENNETKKSDLMPTEVVEPEVINKELSLEDVLKAAKEVGANSVSYKEFKITL